MPTCLVANHFCFENLHRVMLISRPVSASPANGADWSKCYPLISESAGRIQGSAILDTEVVWLDPDGMDLPAVCQLGLEGIVSKKLDAPYRSGPSKNWI